jgi:hypothetical protein
MTAVYRAENTTTGTEVAVKQPMPPASGSGGWFPTSDWFAAPSAKPHTTSLAAGIESFRAPDRLWRVEPRLCFSTVKFPDTVAVRDTGEWVMRHFDLGDRDERWGV